MIRQLNIISCALAFIISVGAQAQKTRDSQGPLFPKGDKGPSDHFTGTVWINTLVADSEPLDCVVTYVTFEPGARTYWHKHPGGQALLVTEGIGYYQEKGKPIQLIRKGDVIKFTPGVVHWHGATPESALTHIAVTPNLEKGAMTWLQEVSDSEYKSYK